jgi:hypothetical protein
MLDPGFICDDESNPEMKRFLRVSICSCSNCSWEGRDNFRVNSYVIWDKTGAEVRTLVFSRQIAESWANSQRLDGKLYLFGRDRLTLRSNQIQDSAGLLNPESSIH